MLSDQQRQQLIELIDGHMSEAERATFEVELQHNAELAEEYGILLDLQAASRDWQEQAVPSWSRLAGITRPPVHHTQAWLAWTSSRPRRSSDTRKRRSRWTSTPTACPGTSAPRWSA